MTNELHKSYKKFELKINLQYLLEQTLSAKLNILSVLSVLKGSFILYEIEEIWNISSSFCTKRNYTILQEKRRLHSEKKNAAETYINRWGISILTISFDLIFNLHDDENFAITLSFIMFIYSDMDCDRICSSIIISFESIE